MPFSKFTLTSLAWDILWPWDTAFDDGTPVLLRTVEAIAHCPSVSRIAVLMPPGHGGFQRSVDQLLKRARVPRRKKIYPLPSAGRDPVLAAELGRIRRLAPDAWRAGWAIPFAMAEWVEPVRLQGVMRSTGQEEALLFPSMAPFVCTELVEELVAGRAEASGTGTRLATLPPGVCGDLVAASYVDGVVAGGLPLDSGLRFIPGEPRRDLDTNGVYHWFPERWTALRHRMTIESKRGLAIAGRIDEWRRSHGGDEIGGAWLSDFLESPDSGAVFSGPVPRELRVRITDQCRQDAEFDVPSANPDSPRYMDTDTFDRLVEELGRWQETRLVVTGGEALLHPEALAFLQRARQAGVGSVVLETDGLGFDQNTRSQLVDRVDGVVVTIDAVEPATYERIHGADRLAEVEAAVRACIEEFAGKTRAPFVAVEMRESAVNADEVEPFLHRWFPHTPWVIVGPYRNRVGQLPGDPLHTYRMPRRRPCVRLEDQMLVEPDGRVAVCDNDIHLRVEAGDVRRDRIEDLWSGGAFAGLRSAHAEESWDAHPLCGACTDWCRRG